MSKVNYASLVAFFLGCTFVVLVFFKVASIYLGNNPLNKSYYSQIKFASGFPQGWAFFTKSAKDPQIFMIEYDKPRNIKILNFQSTSTDFYLGVSRHNRILNVEIGNILSKLDSTIKPYQVKAKKIEDIFEYIKAKKIKFTSINIEKKLAPDFNGEYVIVIQEMLPWPLMNKIPDYPSNFTLFPIIINRI